jgi:hypothetical protein
MFLAESIKTVALGLEPLGEEFVFVGGSVVECYATSITAELPRPTDDIDVVLELAHYGRYSILQEKLISAGFNPDNTSKVICRYQYRGITVDIMPDDPNILGFTNRWYRDGIKNSIQHKVDELLVIRIFSTPFFVASKIEAYKQRGAKDKRLSSDFEDIVYIIENRSELIDEVLNSPSTVREYIVEFCQTILRQQDTLEAIAAVMGYIPSPRRVSYVHSILEKLAQ